MRPREATAPTEPRASGATRPSVRVPSGLTIRVDAGPDAGRVIRLGPGRHVIGRARDLRVRLDDALVEPHHLLVDVTGAADGVLATVHQLTGRWSVTVDGEVLTSARDVRAGSVVELGASRLVLDASVAGHATGPIAGPLDPVVARRPRARPARPAAPRVVLPSPPVAPLGDGLAGLAAAGAGLVGAVAVAVLLGQPGFALLAGVAAIVAAVTSLAGRLATRRSARRAAAEHSAAVADVCAQIEASTVASRQHHEACHPGVASALDAAPWLRRPGHGDALTAVLGVGDVEDPVLARLADASTAPPPPVAAAFDAARTLRDVAVPIDLAAVRCLAITGPGCHAVARSVVAQLAVSTGPADWRLVVVVDETSQWGWTRPLPHHVGGGDLVEALGSAPSDRHLLVVVDDPATVRDPAGPLRRLLAADRPVTVMVLTEDARSAPGVATAVLELGVRWRATWQDDLSAGELPVRLHASGVGVATATDVASRLRGLIDPEDVAGGARVPTSVALHEVGIVADADRIAARWVEAGDDPAPAAVIGAGEAGWAEVDLVRDGPHALVAGTTGSGKSELLRTLVLGLATAVPPEHLCFVLVDYKGGAAFDGCGDLPHVVGLVTDLDGGLAERALVSLDAELRRRERLLRDAGAESLTAYRARRLPPLARLVVVVDEFAALAAELPDFLRALVSVAQRGRSLGVHLVLATQRPAGVVDDHVRANTDLRIALRLQDAADSTDVVGVPDAAVIARTTPGRALVRCGPDRPHTVQAASAHACPDPDGQVRAVVAAVRAGAERRGVDAPAPPWTPPLPRRLAHVGAGAVGLVDDPAQQRQVPLRWRPGAGHLALVGSLGSGTTTALRSIVHATVAIRSVADVHVTVIDAKGSGALDALGDLPHCAGVVRLHETERVGRALQRLLAVLERRRAGGEEPGADHVLVIDGLTALRGALAELPDADGGAALERLVADGAGLGVAVVATVDPGTSVGWMSRFAERWVFHLDDPADAPSAGVRPARVPPAIPGRIVVASSGLDAQLAIVPAPETTVVPADGAPAPIAVLPRRLPTADLDALGVPGAPQDGLPVGQRFDDLGLAVLRRPRREHVLVVGPSGSGRTTTLAALAAAWRRDNAGGTVLVVTPERPHGVTTVPTGRPVLVLVDDADRIDDPDPVLLATVERPAAGTLVVAAARGDVLRGDFAHWAHALRRSRLGLVMAAAGEADRELLGGAIPRRCPLPSRPGLAWLVDGGQASLVQVATPENEPCWHLLTSSALEVVRSSA